MVGLDDGGLSQSAFDDVGVDGALHQVVHGSDLLGFLFKYPDEFFSDDLTLLLRLLHAGQGFVEAVAGIHVDEVQVVVSGRSEDLIHGLTLVLPQQAVVHEHAGELLADGFGHEHGRN